MRKVNGHTPFVIQKQGEFAVNAIGEKEQTWVDSITFFGVLGMQSGKQTKTATK